MRLHLGIFLFLFSGSLAICPQIVRAQNQFAGHLPIIVSEIPAAKIEKPVRAPQTPLVIDRPHAIVRPPGEKDFPATNLQTALENIELENIELESVETNFGIAVSDEKADFRGASLKELKKEPFQSPRAGEFKALRAERLNGLKIAPEDDAAVSDRTGFNWRGALSQSFIFLGVQHGFALILQEKTRRSLKGKFWKDYADSVKALKGWDDGGKFFTNYIAHPMQGSFTGFIYVQNSPQARRAEFGASRDYWSSRMKAMLWTAAWSTQFEIGPISQASIGNVGLGGKQTWEDVVVTPTLGTAMLVLEDAVDRYIIKSIERRWDNFYVKIFSRMILNPTRLFANMLRFKAPWHRDRPTAR